MSVSANRGQNLALGINLGWIQQGAAYGGRPIQEMTADLERIRNHALLAGYQNYSSFVDVALNKLNLGQPAASVIPEVNNLIGIFQGSSTGQAAQALALGINLGWLQQGARAGNRPVNLALEDLKRAREHARLANYQNYDGYIANAEAKLRSTQQIRSISGELETVIGVLQSQN
jgi:hypothetical protein